jgi:hypothetical protein
MSQRVPKAEAAPTDPERRRSWLDALAVRVSSLAGDLGPSLDAGLFDGHPLRAFAFVVLIDAAHIRLGVPPPDRSIEHSMALVVDLAVLADCAAKESPRPLPVGSSELLLRAAEWLADAKPAPGAMAGLSSAAVDHWIELNAVLALRLVAVAASAIGDHTIERELLQLVASLGAEPLPN